MDHLEKKISTGKSLFGKAFAEAGREGQEGNLWDTSDLCLQEFKDMLGDGYCVQTEVTLRISTDAGVGKCGEEKFVLAAGDFLFKDGDGEWVKGTMAFGAK